MSTELEERLRERMDHATADIQVPRGLARQAARHRRRRIVTQSGAAAATAGAVAAAIAVAGATGASRDTGTTVTARLASNVESALATAAGGGEIVYLQTTNGLEDSWFYQGQQQQQLSRSEFFSASGQPLSDEANVITSTSMTFTTVSYDSRTWWTIVQKINGHGSAPDPQSSSVLGSAPVPQTSCGTQINVGPDQDPATLTANIREALVCGQLTDEGTENVNGVNAIKLVSVRTLHGPHALGIVTMTVWVDPATYLPARFQISMKINGRTAGLAQNATWLPPTSANLARLHVSIPAGFTHVQPPKAMRAAQAQAGGSRSPAATPASVAPVLSPPDQPASR